MERQDVIAALGALGQEHRLDIFRLLVQCGPEGMPAGQIGEKLGLPAATLSFHLGQLRVAGLVTARRLSRQIIYAADYAAMTGLMTFLTANCCASAPAACGIVVCDPATASLVPIPARSS